MSNMHKREVAGFTIVELLIVIVVIAILAAISVVAYNGIQQRARDAQRVSDLNSLRKALEVYYIDNGEYPQCAGSNVCSTTGWSGNLLSLPIDPSPTSDPSNVNGSYGYYYARSHTKSSTGSPTSSGDPKDYVIATRLEVSDGAVFSGWNNTSLNWYHSVDN